MELLRATRLLFAAHLRSVLLSRRALICLAIVLLPVLASTLVVLVSQRHHGGAPALAIGWVLQVQFVVPLVTLIVGSGVMAEEIEGRTITYLFTRPIPRSSVLLGRWLAALVLVLALLAISSTSATLILAHVNPGRRFEPPSPEVQRRLLETVLIGGAVYSAVFAALGGMLKHSIIFGLAYTFVVEGFLANLPGGNQKITIVYYLRSFLVGADPSIRSQLGEALTNTPLVPAGRALATLVGILFGALLLGGLVVRRKQYVLPS